MAGAAVAVGRGRPVAHRTGVRALPIVVLLSLLGACAAPGSTPAVGGRHVQVPAVPLPPAAAWRIDADVLDHAWCAGCEADPPRFLYGVLPMAAFDAIDAGPTDSGGRAGLLGNLFVSGYFGGLHLRGQLGDLADRSSARALLDPIGGAGVAAIDASVTQLLDVADHGDDAAVLATARSWSPTLAQVYGYNRGYLEVVLDHPPAGTDTPTGVTCPSDVECRVADLPLAALDALAPARDRLDAATTATATDTLATGRGVWESILDGAGFDPAGYRTLVDLSGGFLEATQAAWWATAAAGRDADIALGRRGLRLAAGLVLWSGAYFLGLASPLAAGVQPSVVP